MLNSKEELFQFISQHYLQTIIEQIKETFFPIDLVLDLTLILDSRPHLGAWIMNYYPNFLTCVHQVIHEIMKPSEVAYDQFFCRISFSKVPVFETQLHELQYRLTLQEKKCGSLIHLKNAVIVSVDQPKTYVYLELFQCKCDKVRVKYTHLIDRLRNYDTTVSDCSVCGVTMRLLEKQHKLCQRLQLHLHDTSPLNMKKFGNMGSTVRRFRHQFSLMDVYIEDDNINKFQVGNQIYSLAYYWFNLNASNRNPLVQQYWDYCYAIKMDQYHIINNRIYFNRFKSLFRVQESQIIDYDNTPEKIKDLIDKSRRHHSYGISNRKFIEEIINTVVVSIEAQELFALKFSIQLSIFLENLYNIPYYISNRFESRSNILIHHLEQEKIERHLHLAILYTDPAIITYIQQLIEDLDNVVWLPQDCDELTFDYIAINVLTNGILILQREPNKVILQKIQKIIRHQPIECLKRSMTINCAIWFVQETLYHKDLEVFSLKDLTTLTDFDLVIDTSCHNLKNKLVKCDQSKVFDLQTTEKKHFQERAFSSCYCIKSYYLVIEPKKEIFQYQNEWGTKLQEIHQSTLEFINSFFIKFRQQSKCGPSTLHTILKVSTISAVYRNFIYAQSSDPDGIYQSLLMQKTPISYADSILAILLVLDTRVNALGPSQAIFGSDVANYFYSQEGLSGLLDKLINYCF